MEEEDHLKTPITGMRDWKEIVQRLEEMDECVVMAMMMMYARFRKTLFIKDHHCGVWGVIVFRICT